VTALQRVSVIIPTLGRCREVIDTVEGLLAQTVLPDEILVVDQNQPAFEELDSFLARQQRVRHFRSPQKGTAINSNTAIALSRGDILLFVDDDVRPEPQLVEKHLANYSDASVIGVAGRVESPSGDHPPDRIREVGRYHRWNGRVVGNFNARTRCRVDFAQGANMSFRRDAVIAAGGCDVGFAGNAYRFETELALRVLKSHPADAAHLTFDPDAALFHLMAPAGGNRVHDKARGTYYFIRYGLRLYRRHSPAVGLPFFASAMFAYATLKALYNRQARIFTRGIAAIADGLRQPMHVDAMRTVDVVELPHTAHPDDA
jgi:glycosyltransferase involved in cell wall biosynthesis